MPLFGSKRQQSLHTQEDQYIDRDANVNNSPTRKDGFFHRHTNKGSTYEEPNGARRSRSGGRDDYASDTARSTSGGGGIFSRNRGNGRSSMDEDRLSHSSSGSYGASRSGSRLTRGNGNAAKDPAILAARQKVSDAEESERMADRALVESRQAVQAARQHAKDLEREVEMEARMAKLKQQEARSVSKSAKGLGRHM